MEEKSIKEMRELGISLWKSGLIEKDENKKFDGIKLLIEAYNGGDVEAAAWIGQFVYQNILKIKDGDPKKEAVDILYKSALRGSILARTVLNKLCFERSEEAIKERAKGNPKLGPLVGFDGKEIVINKTGLLTPVDAVLKFDNGINILYLSVNLLFISEGLQNEAAFEEAVISGIKEWEGEYQVFGGQSLKVVINITSDNRLFDNVIVMPVTEDNASIMRKAASVINTENARKNVRDLIDNGRSMALTGMRKWSTRSRKLIYIASPNKQFNDIDEIKHVAKHEFGHALGLGDLYSCQADQLDGVEKGTFAELDGFYINDKNYNLVMSDHHGPISNNDIEMVVLAFSEDRMQLYQKDKRFKEDVSKALGRGN